MPAQLSDTDLRLIELLRQDGRAPNKVLAAELGVAETTVASRIRQLRDDGVMRVILRRDLYSKGYDLQCFADVSVQGRSVDEVGRDLAALNATTSVSVMLGTPEILAIFNAQDRKDLLRILEEDIASVPGVAQVELHTAMDIRKYQTGYAAFGANK